MSIYATSYIIAFRVNRGLMTDTLPEYVEVTFQGVPSHINYTGRNWKWLPPPVEEDCGYFRAVVAILDDTEKKGQRYINPLFIMTGEEYANISFSDMQDKCIEALQEREYDVW